jgi:hypothetical protein
MLVHRLFAPIRRLLPGWLSRPLHNGLVALLTPFHFAYATGHFRSALRSRALTRDARPLPWYSYPAIEFLCSRSFEGRSVLEFGAGQSTLFWSERAERVVALESDARWHDALKPRLPPHATLHLVSSEPTFERPWNSEGLLFDVIVVDGLDRATAAARAVDLLKPGGALILDNSDCPWSEDGRFAILEELHRLGFSRVDFHGYAPGNISPQCTSLFFKGGCFLLDSDAPPRSVFA